MVFFSVFLSSNRFSMSILDIHIQLLLPNFKHSIFFDERRGSIYSDTSVLRSVRAFRATEINSKDNSAKLILTLAQQLVNMDFHANSLCSSIGVNILELIVGESLKANSCEFSCHID